MVRYRNRIVASHGLMCVACALLIGLGGCVFGKKKAGSGPPEADQSIDNRDIDLPDRLFVSDATLGPGDVVRIVVYRHEAMNRTERIPASGKIFLPLGGELDVLGLSPIEVRHLVTERLDRYVVNPQVSVQVTIRRSQKVMVLGEVARPSVFQLDGPMTAVEALVRAGDITDEATIYGVVLVRRENGQTTSSVLNVSKTFRGKGENPLLRPGDILYVPKSSVTYIDRFARHMAVWLSPFITAETGILLGDDIEKRFHNDNGASSTSTIFIGQ